MYKSITNKLLCGLLIFILAFSMLLGTTIRQAYAVDNYTEKEITKIVTNYFDRNFDVIKKAKKLSYDDLIKNQEFKQYVDLNNEFKISLNQGVSKKIKDVKYDIKYNKISLKDDKYLVDLELTTYTDKSIKSKNFKEERLIENHIIVVKRYDEKLYIDLDIYDSLAGPDESLIDNPNYLKDEINGVKEALTKVDSRIKLLDKLYNNDASNITVSKDETTLSTSSTSRTLATITAASTYNPTNAVAYAAKWWNSYNPSYPNFGSTSEDCSNFVSQCLYAGGIPMDSQWYSLSTTSYSLAWIRVVNLHTYLTSTGKASSSEFNLYDSNSGINYLPYAAKAGSLMQLKRLGSSNYSHTVIINRIYNGDIKYAGHSSARYDASTQENIINDWHYAYLRYINMY